MPGAPSTSAAEPRHGRAKIVPARDTLLLPYQARWVKDNSRLKIMEKARQIGLSWATAYRLVSTTSLKGQVHDDWVTSRDDLQAQLLIQDCKAFAGLLQIAATDLGQSVIDDGKHSAYVLRYANGRQTHSLSSNPDAQAGKRGRRVLDEFALNPDPRQLYAIAYPGITWGGSLEIISTHRGSANFFNELVGEAKHKGNPKKVSLHTVTLQTALDDGFLYKLQSKLPEGDQRQQMDEADYWNFIRAGCADEESFQQEFCCNPADDNSAFLSYDLIAGCEYRAEEKWELTLEQLSAPDVGPLYLGVDVGRRKDLSAFWLFAKQGDVLYTRLVKVFKATPFAEQRAFLYDLLRLPSMRRCCIDATGLGMQFAEEAATEFGYKVEPVTFTPAVKEELAYPLKAAFEDRTLRIPGDRLIRSHLRAIAKETTASGNTRFAADRGPDGHADLFWAPALAKHAAKTSGELGAWVA